MECRHTFVRSGHGYDLVCTKCGKAAMQAAIPLSSQSIASEIKQPIMRETVKVPFYDGEKNVSVSVYKDELEKEMKKALMVNINRNLMRSLR